MKPKWRSDLPPQPLEPRRVGSGIFDGVLNIPVSQVVLNQPRVGALVGQGKAACMAQHMRVSIHGQACELAIGADRQPGRFTAQGATPFTDKERISLRLHSRPFCQPGFDNLNLICS